MHVFAYQPPVNYQVHAQHSWFAFGAANKFQKKSKLIVLKWWINDKNPFSAVEVKAILCHLYASKDILSTPETLEPNDRKGESDVNYVRWKENSLTLKWREKILLYPGDYGHQAHHSFFLNSKCQWVLARNPSHAVAPFLVPYWKSRKVHVIGSWGWPRVHYRIYGTLQLKTYQISHWSSLNASSNDVLHSIKRWHGK